MSQREEFEKEFMFTGLAEKDKPICRHFWNKGFLSCTKSTSPQWIPVSERLPDDGQFVLAVIGGSVQQYTFSVRKGWWESQDDCSVSYAVKDQVVTHWMSLPSPPAAPRDASMPNHI